MCIRDRQFTYYSKDEWAEKLPQQGTLTYDDVSGILELLHLKEYIPLDDSKKNIDRAAWFAIYDEILSYLDTDTSVLKKAILVLKKEKKQLTTQDGTYAITSNPKWYQKLHSYGAVSYTHLDVYKRQHPGWFLQSQLRGPS